MNRDELLEACFGDAELAEPRIWFGRLPDIGDGATLDPAFQGHVLSLVGLGYRPVIVRNSVAPGSGITTATTTVKIAAIMNVCTDPDHRGKGYATELMGLAHDEARQHALTAYCGLFAGPDMVSFYEQFGYHHPPRAPEHFLVASLGEEPWPEGSVDTRGTW